MIAPDILYFTVFFLILSYLGRQVRRAFRNIRRTLPEIGSVLILFALILGLFSFDKKQFGGRFLRNFPINNSITVEYLWSI